MVVIIALAAALYFIDRAGFFGRAPLSDWEKYHDRQFKVVKIIDGDTLDVDIPDGRSDHTRIRLWGVDTPETVKPNTPVEHFGPEASRFTRLMAMGRTVTLKLHRPKIRDRYKRLLAYLILPDGRNLCEEIIATGHGYADPRFDHSLKRRFKQAQNEAKQARRGLWKNVTDANLPYYYRGKLRLPKPE